MGKFEKASGEERILHSTNTSKSCERGTETAAEGQAELHIYHKVFSGVTETHLNREQAELLRMTNVLANPFTFT